MPTPPGKRRGWFEEYTCGCVSPIVRLKRELLGYCPKHGHSRRHVHRVDPRLDQKKWE
jgi:hypothetical protein